MQCAASCKHYYNSRNLFLIFLAISLQNGTVWAPVDNASFCCSIFYNNVSEVQGSFDFDSSTFEDFFNSLVDLILVRGLDR